jgi:hypothetical protein
MRVLRSGFGAVMLPAALAFCACLFSPATAGATGTMMIQQPDGGQNVYHDVAIKVIHSALYLSSQDGKGTLVINRAACSYQGKLMVCLPTSATLVQSGKTSPLDFQQGTVYLNSTDDPVQMTASTQKVPAHSIVLAFTTQRGTFVSLSGRIDKVVK